MKASSFACALVLVAFALLRVAQVRHAEIEVDELQHLHAGYLVASGQTPYVDFFEHHTPLFYHLAGALIDPMTASSATVLSFRWASLAAHFLTIALGACLAARLGADVAIAALAFLCVEIFSFAWGTLGFLDSFAAPLVMGSAIILAMTPRSRWAWACAGVLLGTAVLLTQKAAFAMAAPLLLWWFETTRPGPSRGEGLLVAAAFVAGALAPLVTLLAFAGWAEIAGLWENAAALNLRWVARRWPVGELFIAVAYNAALWGLAVLGTVAALFRKLRSSPVRTAAAIPFLYLLALLVGAVVMPVVWYEYFIEIGPFAAVAAAITAVDLARIGGLLPGVPAVLPPSRVLVAVASAGLVLATLVSVALRVAVGHYSPSLSSVGLAAAAAAIAGLALAAIRYRRRRGNAEAAFALLLLLCVVPLVSQLEWLRRAGNDGQRRAIDLVHRRATTAERVFDGYSGYGVFRAHAYRYWFLHDEIQQMLGERERGPEILESLADPRVTVAIRDRYLEGLPASVQQYLDVEFRRESGPIWVRRSEGSELPMAPVEDVSR